MECLVAADVVVGGGGYNTVYECAALKVPLVAFAMKHLYTRQDVRLNNMATIQRVKSVEDAIAAVVYYLKHARRNNYEQPNFINGAVSAASLIKQLISTTIPLDHNAL